MFFKDQVYVILHTPGLFFEEIKRHIQVNMYLIPIETTKDASMPEYEYEIHGDEIEVDLSYEIVTELNTKETPCHHKGIVGYSKDDCVLDEILEVYVISNMVFYCGA